MLLEAGADPDLGNDDNQTPLMLAARQRSLPIAQLLVEAGAKVDAHENYRGQTALMWAIGAGSAELTDLFISHKADIERRSDAHDWGNQMTSEPRTQYRPTGGLTPLLYATRSGCLECAQSLVQAGADVNRPTLEGVTPLMNAIDNGNYAIANYLLDQGADPHRADWWARNAVYIAVDMRTRGGGGPGGGRGGGPGGPGGIRLTDAPAPPPQATALQVLERLLAMGVEVNSQLNTHRPLRGRFTDDLLTTGCTPLLRAAVAHDLESIALLLEHGALPDLPNVMGVTPLMAAAGLGRGIASSDGGVIPRGPDPEGSAITVIGALLEAGADINARVTDTSSRTAIIARPSGMTSRQGQTAIFGTIGRSWTRATQFLIDNGARVDVKDDEGKTLLDAVVNEAGGRDPEISDEMVQLIKAAVAAND
jgi:ankyrin repeat protein